MSVSRSVSLTLLATLATVWAGTMVVAGLWLLLSAPGAAPELATVSRVAGGTAIAAGQLVFMLLVADRLFPAAAQGATEWIEMVMSVLVIAGFLWLALTVVLVYSGADL